LRIRKCVDEILADLSAFGVLTELMNEEQLTETKYVNTQAIKEKCNEVNGYTDLIISIMPHELDISSLYR
jgi:hypothetical protein